MRAALRHFPSEELQCGPFQRKSPTSHVPCQINRANQSGILVMMTVQYFIQLPADDEACYQQEVFSSSAHKLHI